MLSKTRNWIGKNEALFTSKSAEWETPDNVYSPLNKEFSFTLDPAATHQNHKCDNYFTIEEDGLAQSWAGHSVFLNPPYGRIIGKWVEKAYFESQKGAKRVVCLIPARTDTAYFHDYCMLAYEIRFIRGRLKFINRTLPSYGKGGKPSPAPFPSMVVLFTKGYNEKPKMVSLEITNNV